MQTNLENITNYIEQIKEIQNDIKQAIKNKNEDFDENADFADYAEAINNLDVGGGENG